MALLVILGITLIILGLLSLLFMYLEDEKYNYQDYKLGLFISLIGIVLMFIASLKDISKENNLNNSKKVQVMETNESIK